MKSRSMKIKEAQEYNENPFLKDLNIPIVPNAGMYVSKDKNIVNVKTEEIDDDVLLTGKKSYVDREQFVKIFIKEIGAIFDLSKASRKVFAYMLSKVRYDDLLMLNMDECLEKTGYRSRGPLFKSLAELIQKQFIAKTRSQFVYWTNPKLFYKGDRLVVVREYRKAKKDKLKAHNQLDMFKKNEEGIKKLTDRIES